MDEELVCKDCQRTFILTDSEKDFFEKKGLSLPKRCVDCRLRKKQFFKQKDNVNP